MIIQSKATKEPITEGAFQFISSSSSQSYNSCFRENLLLVKRTWNLFSYLKMCLNIDLLMKMSVHIYKKVTFLLQNDYEWSHDYCLLPDSFTSENLMLSICALKIDATELYEKLLASKTGAAFQIKILRVDFSHIYTVSLHLFPQ